MTVAKYEELKANVNSQPCEFEKHEKEYGKIMNE